MIESELGVLKGYRLRQTLFISSIHQNASDCRYVMRSSMEWDRFMRFMERYAEGNGLGFEGCAFLHLDTSLLRAGIHHS